MSSWLTSTGTSTAWWMLTSLVLSAKSAKSRHQQQRQRKYGKLLNRVSTKNNTTCPSWLQTGQSINQSFPSIHSTWLLSLSPTEETNHCQGSAIDPYSETQIPPVAGHLLTYSPASDAPDSWPSFSAMAGEGSGSLAYSLSSEGGLSITGQQYATSLLNLLHNDRGEMGPSMASSSKPELHPSWTMPQGFRESVEPAESFEAGKSSHAI